ncbi:UNVERIFIED_CONTAM: hypothetical protein FKN15_020396 [Acipenser sinensis]
MGVPVRPHSEHPGTVPHHKKLDVHDFHLYTLWTLRDPEDAVVQSKPGHVLIHTLSEPPCYFQIGEESSHGKLEALIQAKYNYDGVKIQYCAGPPDPDPDHQGVVKEVFVLPHMLYVELHTFLDPCYDYDFTEIRDNAVFERGGETYTRPCGWYRFALKVLGKYEDGNGWLGARTARSTATQSVPGEWPVSYHGTNKDGAKKIPTEYYKPGNRARYGRGIYSTPNLKCAEGFSTVFTDNNKNFKVVLQNRINPKKRKIVPKYPDYWLIETTEEEEKEAVYWPDRRVKASDVEDLITETLRFAPHTGGKEPQKTSWN